MRSMTTYLLHSLLVACVSSQDSWRFVGEFTNFQHNIKGSLYINGSHELVIKNFDYDGQGPSGDNNIFFYAVNSSYPYSPEDVERGYRNSRGFKLLLPFPSDGKVYQYEDDIPDLRSHFQVLMKEQGVDRKSVSWDNPLVLRLPETLHTEDITFLSVWCRKLGINFGHVEFPLKTELYG